MKTLIVPFLVASFLGAANAQQQTRVAYARVDYIISKLPELKDAQQQMQNTRAALEKQYAEKRQIFQEQYRLYAENAANMADTTRTRVEEALQQASLELQDFDGSARRTLENTEKLVFAPLYLRANAGIREVANANGYAIVLNGIGDLVLYGGEKHDISDLVIAYLTGTAQEK